MKILFFRSSTKLLCSREEVKRFMRAINETQIVRTCLITLSCQQADDTVGLAQNSNVRLGKIHFFSNIINITTSPAVNKTISYPLSPRCSLNFFYLTNLYFPTGLHSFLTCLLEREFHKFPTVSHSSAVPIFLTSPFKSFISSGAINLLKHS